jgi:hypothetical protein
MRRSCVKFLFFYCFRNNFIDCKVYGNAAQLREVLFLYYFRNNLSGILIMEINLISFFKDKSFFF